MPRVLESLEAHPKTIVVADSFGHWLAGFIDGEGCFTIVRITNGENYTCRFSLELRLDDEDIIQEIYRLTGIGRISYRERDTGNPQITWHVTSKQDTQALVALLEKYPLRAKKARDFDIWKKAVTYTSRISRGGYGADWAPMIQFKNELNEIKRYTVH